MDKKEIFTQKRIDEFLCYAFRGADTRNKIEELLIDRHNEARINWPSEWEWPMSGTDGTKEKWWDRNDFSEAIDRVFGQTIINTIGE